MGTSIKASAKPARDLSGAAPQNPASPTSYQVTSATTSATTSAATSAATRAATRLYKRRHKRPHKRPHKRRHKTTSAISRTTTSTADEI